MTGTAAVDVQTIRDGGFRIEIGPDDLVVAKDSSARRMPRVSVASIVWIILICFVGRNVALHYDPNFFHVDQSFLIGFPLLIAIFSVFILWPVGVNNIHATRESLAVTRLMASSEAGRWVFPRAAIRQIRFAPVKSGGRVHEVLFGREPGAFEIRFDVEGNKVLVLRGIESPEALTVLRELSRLGFDVEGDIAMQIVSELAWRR